jgi:serine/threonine-protein kinase
MKTISHYEILSPVGEGGMGSCIAPSTRVSAAPSPSSCSRDETVDRERKKRFIQEARAASGLNHPNIVTIFDLGENDDLDFIAMEYVAGRSLASLISGQRLSIDESLN